ncbi:MAG TPA: malonate decarboxylase subunit alpha [Rhodopila sp.]|nr:malonate decarboxylase subunit alpha [Rhodopila sp.]
MSENPSAGTPHRDDRFTRLRSVCDPGTKICPPERATALLEAIVVPSDRVTIEGDNQKQADLLAAALANIDPARVHDLHAHGAVGAGATRASHGVRARHCAAP